MVRSRPLSDGRESFAALASVIRTAAERAYRAAFDVCDADDVGGTGIPAFAARDNVRYLMTQKPAFNPGGVIYGRDGAVRALRAQMMTRSASGRLRTVTFVRTPR